MKTSWTAGTMFSNAGTRTSASAHGKSDHLCVEEFQSRCEMKSGSCLLAVQKVRSCLKPIGHSFLRLISML